MCMKGCDIMSPREKEFTERINIFLSPEVLENLKQQATKRGTNVSSLSRFIITQWLLEQITLDDIGMKIEAGMNAENDIERLNYFMGLNRKKFV